jgi:hypothetical protein
MDGIVITDGGMNADGRPKTDDTDQGEHAP